MISTTIIINLWHVYIYFLLFVVDALCVSREGVKVKAPDQVTGLRILYRLRARTKDK